MEDRISITLDNGVADVRLNRPDKMNALDRAMFDGLNAAIAKLEATPGLRAVVLSGEGRAFCAGLDMGNFRQMGQGGGGSTVGSLDKRSHGLANHAQNVAWGWRQLPVPVIAALHGVAFGGGFQIAIGADIRIAAPDLRMSVMEIRWGLVPDMAGLALMRSLARDDVIRELSYTGRQISGEEAVQLGFATRTAADPRAEALELARAIANNSPDAVRAGKRLFNMMEDSDAGAILLAESVEQMKLIGSPNQVEAVRAGLEKRAPRFSDAG
ncbi:MAG: crotonase/enoyl-CoA hydratase family protein [Pseudomonadota bacterium]|nr:crotonase/enoyl-CoA hydratase family protein [Pseudomonadota bacterium]